MKASFVLLLGVLGIASLVLGQNLLVNGDFNEKALARIQIGAAGSPQNYPSVADGDTVEIDVAGTNRVYEFDMNGSIVAGHVAVPVATNVTKPGACSALRTAINNDSLAPCTSPENYGGQRAPYMTLQWKTLGGLGAVNTSAHNANGVIFVSDFGGTGTYGCPKCALGGAVSGWTGLSLRNGDVYVPACRPGGACATLTSSGVSSQFFSQTVSGLTPGVAYTAHGYWWLGEGDASSTLTAAAELRDGSDPGAALLVRATALQTGGGQTNAWLEFAATGVPTGSQMTLVISGSYDGSSGWSVHVDDVSLAVATCLAPPAITSISPNHGVRGTVLTGFSILGSNLTSGKTSVKLTREGQPDIVATNVVASDSNLRCDVDLTAAAQGPWNVVVSVGDNPPNQQGCTPAMLGGGFTVVLPALSNGSFELPTAPGGCPATPLAGPPTDWLASEINGYGYAQVLLRDSDSYPPTCPPPNGLHYGSSLSTNNGSAGAEASIYQTVAVSPSTGCTFSGYLAGGGANQVKLMLHDGGPGGPVLASTNVNSSSDAYDWRYVTVTGFPTTDLVTAVWYIDLYGAGPHAAHADAFTLEACTSPVNAVEIAPRIALNAGTVNQLITGSGFVVGSTPVVQFIKGTTRITATSASVLNAGQISCTADFTGASSGKYAVLVKQGGCVAVLPETDPLAFQVVATEFMNGEFEDPSRPLACGPPPTPTSEPSWWNSSVGIHRDGNTPVPPSCPCPLSQGGHYGSMSNGEAGVLQAWQTIRVQMGQRYRFSGWFSGMADCRILLLEGDETGRVLASANPYTGGDDGVWHEASVSATAPSETMTVMWLIENVTPTNPGGHADGLQFAADCHAVWADADQDGDVDMDDFAFWQRCVTSEAPTEDCLCFDRALPFGAIDVDDVAAFVLCAKGPAIMVTSCPR